MSIAMRALVIIGLLAGLAAGCEKSSKSDDEGGEAEQKNETGAEEVERPGSEGEAAPAEPAALWELAPAKASGGVVVRAGALEHIASGIATLRDGYVQLPGAEAQLKEAERELDNPAGFPLLRPETWEEFGLDLSKPAAVFAYDDGGAAVVPVGDRQTFVEKLGGTAGVDGEPDTIDDITCAETSGHYVCASSKEMLGEIGEGGRVARAGGERPAELRGEVEGYFGPDTVEEGPVESVSGVLRLERGAVTMRTRVAADTSGIPPVFTTEPRDLTEAMAGASPAGFLHLHLPMAAASMAAPDTPTPLGASVKELASAVTGEIVAYTLAGDEPSGYVKIGVFDPEIFRGLIERFCPTISGRIPGLEAKLEDGRCVGRISTSELAKVAGDEVGSLPLGDFGFEVRVDDDAVVAALNDPENAGSPASEPTAAGRELLSESWNLAAWGSGGVSPETLAAAYPAENLPADAEQAIQAATWLLLHVRELGLGLHVDGGDIDFLARVGTQWANPAEVVDKLDPLLVQAAQGQDVAAELRALAGEHPDTPFGRSLGRESGVVPVAGALGVAAAIAVPAFVSYVAKSKMQELGGDSPPVAGGVSGELE